MKAGTVVRGNDELERNLVVVETVALSNGLHPEVIAMLLDLALSLNAGKIFYFHCIRFQKNITMHLTKRLWTCFALMGSTRPVFLNQGAGGLIRFNKVALRWLKLFIYLK